MAWREAERDSRASRQGKAMAGLEAEGFAEDEAFRLIGMEAL